MNHLSYTREVKVYRKDEQGNQIPILNQEGLPTGEFETDVKGFGFKSVDDWNLAITTLSLAYTNVANDQTSDTLQQIEDVKGDNSIAQDLKDRKISNLKASIPSDNNRKITEELIKDVNYAEKIKQLESTEE